MVRSKTSIQTLTLFISIIFGIPLGILSTTITTRILGPENYGILAFFTTVTTFILIFFRFGFAASSGLLVAEANNRSREQGFSGASILIFSIIGVIYSSFLFCFSFFVDGIFGTSIGHILRWLSLLLFFQPFQYLIQSVTRGANYIGILSLYRISPRILYIVTILILLPLIEINFSIVILVTVLSSLVVTTGILYSLKPSFSKVGDNLRRIMKKNREYGINLYKAQIISMSSSKLSGLLISYFTNTTVLGFYSLAMVMASPLIAFSNAMSTTMFKSFCRSSRIPVKVFVINGIVMICGALLLWFGGRIIILFLYTEEYLEVAALLKFLVVSSIFEGLFPPFNCFLAAKGHAVWLRKIATLVAVTYFVGNIIFVPLWGAYGAATANIFGQIMAFAGHLWFYRKYILLSGNQDGSSADSGTMNGLE